MHKLIEELLAARGGGVLLSNPLPASDQDLFRAYTAAPRRVGRAAVALSDAERQRVEAAAPGLSMAQWTVDDLARAWLLLSAAARPDFVDLATACFEQGDSREQQSWLRALPVLPAAERFLPIAIDACRTNIVPLFESIACENPYPAAQFPERNFNQMVLKALFNSVAIDRIAGLRGRFNEELSRMADDYVSEREAAGRPVPHDIWLVLAPRAGASSLPRVQRYLNDADPAHRRWAAEGLRYR